MCIRDRDNYASLIIGKWKMTSGNAIATHVTYKNDGTFEYTNTDVYKRQLLYNKSL